MWSYAAPIGDHNIYVVGAGRKVRSMSGNPTARDRVWAAVLESAKYNKSFKVRDVRTKMDVADRPSEETIRRVLRAGTELGVIQHRSGSHRYRLADEVMK
jgi:hypothetical protein